MQVSQSSKLANVCYEIRGQVMREAKRLEAEGHNVIPKGKRWLVEGYADKLASGFE